MFAKLKLIIIRTFEHHEFNLNINISFIVMKMNMRTILFLNGLIFVENTPPYLMFQIYFLVECDNNIVTLTNRDIFLNL